VSTYTHSIEVEVPVRSAYDQWTQFETFPQFMEGVQEVDQLTDSRTRWRVEIGGVTREFDATITEQRPDQKVAWASDGEPAQVGVVTFDSLGPQRSRVTLQMDFEPEGAAEKTGDKLGIVERRVKGDLDRFKDFMESRDGSTTGGWRGSIGGSPASNDADRMTTPRRTDVDPAG
jgi:uncharacterized membrane protein